MYTMRIRNTAGLWYVPELRPPSRDGPRAAREPPQRRIDPPAAAQAGCKPLDTERPDRRIQLGDTAYLVVPALVRHHLVRDERHRRRAQVPRLSEHRDDHM